MLAILLKAKRKVQMSVAAGKMSKIFGEHADGDGRRMVQRISGAQPR